MQSEGAFYRQAAEPQQGLLVLVGEVVLTVDQEPYPSRFSEELQQFLETIRKNQPPYPFSVELLTSVEEGSVKGKAKLLAVWSAAFIFFSNYGSVRGGIDAAYQDIRFAVTWTATQLEGFTKHHSHSPHYVEKHTGTLGSLKRAKDDLEFVREHIDDLSNNELRNRLRLIEACLDDIYSQGMNDEERASLGKLLGKLADESSPPLLEYPDLANKNNFELEHFLTHLKQKFRRKR